MQFLSNMKIGMRLTSAFVLLMLMLIGIALVGLSGIGKTFNNLEVMYATNVKPMEYLGDVQQLSMRNRVLVMDMILNPEPANVSNRAAEIVKNTEKVDKSYAAYKATDLTDRDKALIAELDPALAAYRQEALTPTREASLAGKTDEALNIYKTKVSSLAPKVFDTLKKMIELQVALAKEGFDQSAVVKSSVTTTTISVAVIAVLAGIFLAWTITASITLPIGKALQFSQVVASGDLTANLQHESKDEVGALLKSLQAMQASLVKVVGNVRQGSESVSSASSEIA